MRIQEMTIGRIKLNARNARTHPARQIGQIAKSIRAFGFTNPLLVSEDDELIAGHGRFMAAKELGLDTVPVIVVAGLSPTRRRALAIADNRIAQNARWNRERLAIEILELAGLLSTEGPDVSVLGFEPGDIELLQAPDRPKGDPEDTIESGWSGGPAVSKPGDLWVLGEHQFLCGDARCSGDVARLMGGCRADLAFLDLPRGGEPSQLAMADADPSTADFVRSLGTTLKAAASASREGALHFVCTGWRHLPELMAAAEPIYGKAIDVAIWPKSDADPGSLYRGGLEFIGVFCVGPLITGTTVIAAERVGRRARALEVAPQLVDVAVRRWQAATRATAVHAERGLSFDQIAADAARITPPIGAKIMENDR